MGNTLLTFLFLLFFVGKVSGQTFEGGGNGTTGNNNYSYKHLSVQNIIPPSPEASSLGKYIDMPVGLYTGTPEINIPITNISCGNFNLPITLSYHASGLKVEEVASWVGVGWTLNAGGMISRTIRGKRDEADESYQSGDWTSKFMGQGNNANLLAIHPPTGKLMIEHYLSDATLYMTYSDVFSSFSKLCKDAQADIYYFSLPNMSGKFLRGRDARYIFLNTEHQNLAIISHPFANNMINGDWTLIDEQFNKYTFSVSETTNQYSNTGSSGNNPSCLDYSNFLQYYPTSWVLTQIETSSGEFIMFQYEEQNTEYEMVDEKLETSVASIESPNANNGIGSINLNVTDNEANFKVVQVKTRGQRLSKIICTNGQQIHFIPEETSRLDLKGGKALKRIDVYYQATLIKSFSMQTSYDYTTGEGLPEDLHRLKLDKIQEISPQGTLLPPYQFFYYDKITGNHNQSNYYHTSRKSRNQDHWGYANGANNLTMVPELKDLYVDRTQSDPYIEGANREPNFQYARLGILQKIIYPTGGTCEFFYENNTASSFKRPEYQRIKKDIAFGLNSNNGVYSGETLPFLINNKSPQALLKGQVGSSCNIDVSNGQGIQAGCNLVLKNINTGEEFSPLSYVSSNAAVLSIMVPCGTYKLMGAVSGNNMLSIYLEWENAGDTIINKEVGGLRIKKTILTDVNSKSPIIKEYDYSENNNGKSSGRTLCVAANNYYETGDDGYMTAQTLYNISSCAVTNAGIAFVRTANTSYNNLFLKNSIVGYGKVTVKQINSFDENLGMTVNTFLNPMLSENINKIADPISLENTSPKKIQKYGLKLFQTDYKFKNGALKKIIESEIKYDSLFKDVVEGFRVVNFVRSACTKAFAYVKFQEFSEWYYPTYTKTTMYDDSQKAQTTEEFFEYDLNICKVKKKTQKLSNNEQIIQTFKYPSHYTNDMDANILASLNMDGTIVKEETWRVKNGIQTKIGGKRLKNLTPTGNPQEIWVYENQNLLQVPIGQEDTSGELENYKPKAFFTYQGSKLLMQKGEKDIPSSYIWGYSNDLPIAQVVNAKNTDIFHTSFEFGHTSLDHDDITPAKTGRKSKINGFSKNLVDLTNGKYTLTYWKHQNNAWTLQKEMIDVSTNTYTINLSGQLDEVRFYPADAVMTTYTYDPLIGMTSSTDANDQTIYYEYDGFGRLKWVKDFKGNILKQNEYFYRQD